MSGKVAKLFVNGGSQAVRLPAEFRFADADEVFIRRDQVTGDLILSSKAPPARWADFFALRDQTDTADFMAERPLNAEQSSRDPFGDA